MAIVQKKLTGIEIGTKNIKMVKINKRGKITHYANIDIPEGVLDNGKIESEKVFTDTLKSLKKKIKSYHKECAISISSPDIVIRQINLPIMDHAHIIKNIELELAGFLPADPKNYIIDYIIYETIKDDEKNMYLLTVFAIPMDLVKTYGKSIKDAGFKLVYVDVLENAYQKFHKMLLSKKITKAKNFACLHIDNSKASISVYHDCKLFINKVLEKGVGRVCLEISGKTDRPVEKVKDILFTNNIFSSGETFQKEREILEYFTSEIAQESLRVIDYFKSRKKQNVEIIYLSGGFSHIEGMNDYLMKSFYLPVCNAFDLTIDSYKRPPGKDTGVDYTSAVALTLREVDK